jgi:uncharacterized membrane protein YfcA
VDTLSTLVLAWCALALTLAGLVKGATGIGIPLVGISLLSLLISVPQAVALLPVPIILANTWQALTGGYFLHTCRRFAPLLVAMFVGTAIGGGLLTRVDQGLMLMGLGALVLGFALLGLSSVQLRIPARHHRVAGAAAGLAVMFLVSLRLRKEEFVGTISTIYLATGIALGATLAGYGIARGPELLWSALASGPLFVGMLMGQLARRRISERAFRKTLLVLLLLVGLGLVRRGMGL